MEKYIGKHSPRNFYLILTHWIQLWKRKLVQQAQHILKEILILTHRIGHEIANHYERPQEILTKFRHHTARIFASIFIFI